MALALAIRLQELRDNDMIEKIINWYMGTYINYAGLSSLGVPGVPWHTQILADQLTLFQPGGTDYAHLHQVLT